MGTVKLGGPSDLKRIYSMGALSGTKTITNYDIGGSRYTPIEVTITDTQINGKGAFWMCDIDHALHDALENGDTEIDNANLPVLIEIFQEMAAIRKACGQPPYEPKSPLLPYAISAIVESERPTHNQPI